MKKCSQSECSYFVHTARLFYTPRLKMRISTVYILNAQCEPRFNGLCRKEIKSYESGLGRENVGLLEYYNAAKYEFLILFRSIMVDH